MSVATESPAGGIDAFAQSRHQFETVRGWLDSADAGGLEHAELEHRLQDAGRELLPQLLQDHLDLRAHREPRVEVLDCHGVTHRAVETCGAQRADHATASRSVSPISRQVSHRTALSRSRW